jgi:hypothetical protein
MWGHQQIAVTVTLPRDTAMTRPRSWRERWLTLPWKPWVRETATEYALLLRARAGLSERLQAMTGISDYLR